MHKPLKFLYDMLSPISRIPGLGWTVRPLKLIIYTLEGLMAHGTMDMGAALTFYTLMSIVPVLALVFAVVKGFGLVESLVENLYSLLPQMPEVVDYMVDFANKALARTQGGVVATVRRTRCGCSSPRRHSRLLWCGQCSPSYILCCPTLRCVCARP